MLKKKMTSEEFLDLLYGDKISLTVSWEARKAEALRQSGLDLTDKEINELSIPYFENSEEAELYWSYKIMLRNVCKSMREEEVAATDGKAGSENQSYKAKIANGLDMPKVLERMKELKATVFKGNEQAVIDFNTGKRSSGFGTFMDELAKEKRA